MSITADEIRQRIQDPQRLHDVERTDLLDSEPEACFDRLTTMAKTLTGAAVTFLAVVDEDRDYYKSMVGLPEPLRETSIDTLCRRTVADNRVLVIPDALNDPEYCEVEVVKALGIGSYLGIPLSVPGGKPFGTFCAVGFEPHAWTDQDIDVMRELASAAGREIDLRLALEHSRRAVRDRERLLAIVAHDLRNPLSVVLGGVEMLEERVGVRNEDLDAVRRAAASMGDLVEDLLKTSSIDGEGVPLHPRRASPHSVVDDVWTTFRFLGERKRIRIQASAAAPLPDVYIDPQRILRVFANLLSNAVKFSPAHAAIHVAAAPHAEGVEFSVQDEGPGLDADQQEKLFDAFWQANPQDARGVGLGLHIVDQLVRAHGGKVSVTSEPGQGCRFAFVLPPVDPGTAG